MKSSFENLKLKDISKIYSGNSINEKIKEQKYTGLENGVEYISTKDISFNSQISYDNGVKIPFNELDNFKTAPKNTIFICAEGGSAGRKLAISDRELCFVNKLFAVVASKFVLPKYLFYSLKTEDFIEQFNGSMTGIIGGVSLNKFRELEIKVPSISIQQKIVAKLDAIFAEIDTATAAAEANVNNAKQLFESYLKDVFENKSKKFESKKINEISINLDSKRVPITKDLRTNGDVPYYGASGIVDYVSDFLFEEDILLVSEDGANLLDRNYPIAFSVSGKSWVNNHAHVLKFENMISQKFVEFYINSISLKPYVSGMAQPKLNQGMLNKIPIPFPNITIQKDLVNDFETMKENRNILLNSYVKKNSELALLKNSILQKAFNGELVKD